jgi:hypothetical protein
MSMRDKIEETITFHFEERVFYGACWVEDAADAIIKALPDMIPDLVWVEDYDGRGFVALSAFGQYGVFDEGNPRWYSPILGSPTYRYTDTLEQAQDAANAHNRAAGMAIFKETET